MKLSIFCSSKKDYNMKFNKEVLQLFKHLSNYPIHYAYGGGNDGLMGSIRTQLLELNKTIHVVNCERWRDPIDDTHTLIHSEYYNTISHRQSRLIEVSDGMIVLPGGVGTLYETLQVLTMNDIREHKKPVFLFNVHGYYNHLIDMIEESRNHNMITKTNDELLLYICNTSQDMITSISTFFKLSPLH